MDEAFCLLLGVVGKLDGRVQDCHVYSSRMSGRMENTSIDYNLRHLRFTLSRPGCCSRVSAATILSSITKMSMLNS
jgi:hypothetical protein